MAKKPGRKPLNDEAMMVFKGFRISKDQNDRLNQKGVNVSDTCRKALAQKLKGRKAKAA